ncbi:L-threonylcarbamoyladenylate synthase [Alkaliphilus sp. B6464]|uniref:L-threonylcarbamoyladenylate synthase n=1 Tax=Alkaliphilus sp. B6464 TaxID=2731219 RepID=UPI001BA6E9C8|nr:L-threonylcarbamoyladenylate synthase [Alkaliphilus sp. B6464]QUH19111.1 threonylcarbamoyl-AMP synthase [Alkaliphilus sp. B6464]
MKDTMIIEIDTTEIDSRLMNECANILKQGGTVAFPTETVYGLGANALDSKAVKKIFEAKGRPSDNPLIVHVAKTEEILPLVKEIPEKAHRVIEKFWPGPLTLIFEKSSIIPHEISAGLSTVAIRMPSHPIAIRLIEESGVPIAAPSANISGRPSPTKAEHVVEDLIGKVDAIIAGGACNVGVESTVLDMTGEVPMILRPGGVTKEMLEEVLGDVSIDPAVENPNEIKEAPKAPGMKYTHYAPKADVIIIQGDLNNTVNKIKDIRLSYEAENKRVGIICTDETRDEYDGGIVKSMGSRKHPVTIAANLFKVLREFDDTDVEIILSEAVDTVEIGQAIMNRLKKAAGYRIIEAE